MKTFASVAVILTAVAGILGFSMAGALREQERLLGEFTERTVQQANSSVEALSARLEVLDQDTRMLSDLVERSRANENADPVIERRLWSSAFQSMAIVVTQYRALAYIRGDDTLEVLAVDPQESPQIIDALMVPARQLVAQLSSRRVKALGLPTVHGDRSFLLYGTPVPGGGTVVVITDSGMFLDNVAWTALPGTRLFVTDPTSAVWSGCDTAEGCRAGAANTLNRYLPAPPSTVSNVTPDVSLALGLGNVPGRLISERVVRPAGTWMVTWLASAEVIAEAQRALLLRIILTVLVVALGVAVVGGVILRQQRRAAALEGRLHFAQALANARETSESIVENAPLGVLGVSQDGRVVLANSFLTDRLGPIKVGESLREIFNRPALQSLRELEPLLLADVPSGPTGSDHLREERIIATDRQQFHVRVMSIKNHDLGVRAFAMIEDRSELQSLENQLVRAEKLITVGVLSAGIAHEIGSPLAVIRGRAEQVLREVGTGPRAEDLRVIIKHIDQISSTIRQLLDFSRRQPIERRAVFLDDVLEKAKSLLQWKFEARGVRLQLSIGRGRELPMLSADPDQLAQVLVNLLLNACDASSPGTEVELRAAAAETGVTLEVVDRGSGIAPEHMNSVFDPFFTTKRRGEGTGLGLSIVASIVRNHGGRINLASAPGKGTTVTVTWPAARSREAALA